MFIPVEGEELILKGLLDLIRLQKHDFLNHFQVVMGFLQLNRPERALQYVKETLGHLEQSWGSLGSVPQPWLAALMMPHIYKALWMQVRVSIQTDSWPEKRGDYNSQIPLAVSEVWKVLIRYWEQVEIDQRNINISVCGNGAKDSLVFGILLAKGAKLQPAAFLEPVIAWAGKLPVNIELLSTENLLHIKIQLDNIP
ncbi:MAG: Spo0B domain-containing protein [Bacillota bacterium]